MENQITRGIRLASMLVDHFAMTFICGFVLAIGVGLGALGNYLLNSEITMIVVIVFMVVMTFSVYLNKDAINGQSVAKRILKNQVIDMKTDEIASPLKCFIRNLTIPIWIIEIPFVLINPKRRLGDLIAGTRIEFVNLELKSENKTKDIIISLIVGGIYTLIIFGSYILMTENLNKLFFRFLE